MRCHFGGSPFHEFAVFGIPERPARLPAAPRQRREAFALGTLFRRYPGLQLPKQ
jgi:hypothetical protein